MSDMPDLADVLDVLSISQDEADMFGMTFDEFILECAFDRVDCANMSIFHSLYNARYGRCFTFSSDSRRAPQHFSKSM